MVTPANTQWSELGSFHRLPNGQLLVTEWGLSAPYRPYHMYLARLNADGSLDSSFGAGGILQGPADTIGRDVALGAGGKIVVVGTMGDKVAFWHVNP